VLERHQHGKDEQAVSEPRSHSPLPSDLRQPYDGNREDAGGGISSGRKQSVLGLDRAGAEKMVVLRADIS